MAGENREARLKRVIEGFTADFPSLSYAKNSPERLGSSEALRIAAANRISWARIASKLFRHGDKTQGRWYDEVAEGKK